MSRESLNELSLTRKAYWLPTTDNHFYETFFDWELLCVNLKDIIWKETFLIAFTDTAVFYEVIQVISGFSNSHFKNQGQFNLIYTYSQCCNGSKNLFILNIQYFSQEVVDQTSGPQNNCFFLPLYYDIQLPQLYQ